MPFDPKSPEAIKEARIEDARVNPRLPPAEGEDTPRKLPVFGTSITQIGSHCGVGVSLYFLWLKALLVVFTIMALLATPQIIFNSFGDQLRVNGTFSLEMTTIGNLIPNNISTWSQETVKMPAAIEWGTGGVTELSKEQIAMAVTIFDVIGTFVFFLSILWIRRAIHKRTIEVNIATTSAADYSLHIKYLPPDVTEERVRAHFAHMLGSDSLAEVHLARNIGKNLSSHLKRGHLMFQLEVNEAKGKPTEALKKKIDKVEARLKKREQQLHVVAGFVTFETEEARARVLQHYNERCRICMKSDYKLGGKRIRVKEAPEPTNVYWRNLEVTTWGHFWRHLLLDILTFVLLLASFAAIYFGKKEADKFGTGAPCNKDLVCAFSTRPEIDRILQCEKDVAAGMGWNTTLCAAASLQQATDLAGCVGCYCMANIAKVLETTTPVGLDCGVFFEAFLSASSLKGVAVGAVAVVNIVLKIVLAMLARFERAHTVTEESSSIASKVFAGQFMNTALITLVINARVNNFPILPEVLFNGEFNDLDALWYAKVGNSIVFTMLTNAVLPSVVSVVMVWVQTLLKYLKVRSAVTQKQMNKAQAGPEFAIATRYGEVYMFLFVSLMYSSGMPLLLWVNVIAMLLKYWSDKYFLLKIARTPPSYSTQMADQSVAYMPWALLLHLAFGTWTYSIMPVGKFDISSAVSHVTNTVSQSGVTVHGGVVSDFTTRISAGNTLPMFIFLLVVFVCMIFMFLIFTVARGFFTTVCVCCMANKVSPDLEGGETFTDVVKNGKLIGLSTYDIKKNPKYEEMFADGRFNLKTGSFAGSKTASPEPPEPTV